MNSKGKILPWTKEKRTIPDRIVVRRTLFHHLISCSMTHDQHKAKVADWVADDLVTSMITRSNSVLLTANLGWFFFFLSRVVVLPSGLCPNHGSTERTDQRVFHEIFYFFFFPLTNQLCCPFADMTFVEQGIGVIAKKTKQNCMLESVGPWPVHEPENRATGSFFISFWELCNFF